MVVAGVMSGTSADGVDVALCRISAGRGADSPHIKLIGHLETRYPKAVRAALLRVMEGQPVTASEISRLNWRLGEIYAECIERATKLFHVEQSLVGCHGQTLQHEPKAVRHLGGLVRSTWQLGEAAAIAERLRCPVISDFRPADLAAGGEGAPLVPMLDYCLFRSRTQSRTLLNVGGIANFTWLSAGCALDEVKAFDTGPGNMVIDHCMERLFDRAFDKDGAVAAGGRVMEQVVRKLLALPYFSARPPKSCGREEFGAAFVDRLLILCKGARLEDIVATATALTAKSVSLAYERFCQQDENVPRVAHPTDAHLTEMLVAGGGVRNTTLMRMLTAELAPFGVRVAPLEKLGIPSQAKEGVAFALLAWLTWNRLPGNVPSATGAVRPVVLGKVSFG